MLIATKLISIFHKYAFRLRQRNTKSVSGFGEHGLAGLLLAESSNQLRPDNSRPLDTECRSVSVQSMHQELVLDIPESVTVLRVNVGVEASVLAACLLTFHSSHTTVPQLKI